MDSTISDYLYHVLGVRPTLREWLNIDTVPYYLRDAFSLLETELLELPVLLALDRRSGPSSVRSLQGHIEKLRLMTGHPGIYVRTALAAYERKRLIAAKVPFLVPGNQLYLPDLGIDLREYFRHLSTTEEGRPVSPATQAILLTALLHDAPWERWAPGRLAAQRGYSAMTASRVVNELIATGIAVLDSQTGERWVRMERSKAETWAYARRLLRSPVKARHWTVCGARPPRDARIAGLEALARESSLVVPPWHVFAVTGAGWRAVREQPVEVLAGAEHESDEWQVWHYTPAHFPTGNIVDPLSLTLSLQDDPDERVQLALGELKERLPW
jgi:hypothetical protein